MLSGTGKEETERFVMSLTHSFRGLEERTVLQHYNGSRSDIVEDGIQARPRHNTNWYILHRGLVCIWLIHLSMVLKTTTLHGRPYPEVARFAASHISAWF